MFDCDRGYIGVSVCAVAARPGGRVVGGEKGEKEGMHEPMKSRTFAKWIE